MNSYRAHDWLHEPEIIAELIISVLLLLRLKCQFKLEKR